MAWYGFPISSLPPNTSLHPVIGKEVAIRFSCVEAQMLALMEFCTGNVNTCTMYSNGLGTLKSGWPPGYPIFKREALRRKRLREALG